MKTILFYIIVLLLSLSYSFIPLTDTGKTSFDNIVVQFSTMNGCGNNLFIDNFIIGKRSRTDVAPVAIENIPKDITYSIYGYAQFGLIPKVSFINSGWTNVTNPFEVKLIISPGNYECIRQIDYLDPGQSIEVTFDSYKFSTSTIYSIRTFTSLISDEYRENDTISQNTLFLPGAKRNVLFEAYTNASCGPCRIDNPYLDSFIDAHFDTIVAIKYHVWWPGSSDPMYRYNIEQNTWRTNYYNVNAVPDLNVDGTILHIFPYRPETQFSVPFYDRLSIGSPLSLSVEDTIIPGDSIKADIKLTIYSQMVQGNYRLRLNAIERKIHYDIPPGTNGETDFYDVFRRFYPDSIGGIPIPTTAGTYNYVIKYKIDTAWVDSMIYSAVYVQNATTREIINCAKARHITESIKYYITESNNKVVKTSQRPDLVFTPVLVHKYNYIPPAGFYLEPFEAEFPPRGWSVKNLDSQVTFRQVNAANGPSMGGTHSVQIEFYYYFKYGEVDYLNSRTYNNLDCGDSIKFDWAYAPRDQSSQDRLTLKVSTDGGETFPYTIFEHSGKELATADPMTKPFWPQVLEDWRTFAYSICDILGTIRSQNTVPKEFVLYSNFPNPFNPTTTIKFDIPEYTNVKLAVYDINGKTCAILVNEFLSTGTYSLKWDAKNFGSGVYFYKIETEKFVKSKKMVLVK